MSSFGSHTGPMIKMDLKIVLEFEGVLSMDGRETSYNKSTNSDLVVSGCLPAELDQEMEMKESVP